VPDNKTEVSSFWSLCF